MSELLKQEKTKCSEKLEELKNTINEIDFKLSDEDTQDKPFTINDLFLKYKDLGNKCAKFLVQQVRYLSRVLMIQTLSRQTNIKDDCLKFVLCESEGTDLDLVQVVEKDGASHILFSEIDTINCQSLVDFTDQFLKLIGVSATPLLKDFGSYTKTSSSANVDDTLGVPERKRDREDNDDTDSDDSLVSFRGRDNPENETEEGINIDHTDGDDSYDFISHNSENESATTSQARNDVDESVPCDDSVVPSSDNSQNEPGSTISHDCKDLDESTIHDSENNISFHEKKKVKEGINVDHTESLQSNEGSYTFHNLKHFVLKKYEKLNQYYKTIRSSLKCKVVLVYTDTNGDLKIVNCRSNREANRTAYSLKDISKDPIPVVFIKNTSDGGEVSLEQIEACSTEVDQMETPSVYGTLYNYALSGEQGFRLQFKLDTGADSGSVGYDYQIIKHFILTVTNINGKDEPAILCKVKFDTFDGDGAVQVFDIDENSEWNAIGLNQVTFFYFKRGWVVVIGKRVDHVTEVDNEEELRVKFKKDNRSIEPL
jgi:hypothetical protein